MAVLPLGDLITWSDAQRRARLVRRHHLGRTGPDVLSVSRDMVAIHSSDPITPPLALWARLPDMAVDDLDAQLYRDRSLWRVHAMRRTMWVVALDEAPELIAACTADVAARERRKLLGWLEPAIRDGVLAGSEAATWLASVTTAALDELADGQLRTTRELTQLVPGLDTRIAVGSGRWATEVSVSSKVLFQASLEGQIVRGPSATWRSSQYAWADHTSWFGEPLPIVAPDTARAVMVRRYLRAFGPATETDVRWWTGLTAARVRTALATLRAVEVATADGLALTLPDDQHPDDQHPDDQHPDDQHPDDQHSNDLGAGPVVSILSGLDPTVMGWKERAFYLPPAMVDQLFDRNGNAGPTAWVDGRVVGGWGQRPDGTVVLELLTDVDEHARQLLGAEVERLTRWLDGTIVTPRFPSPMSRRLGS